MVAKKNSLRDQLIKNSILQSTAVLSNSIIFNEKDLITTPIPMINVALSARFDGGLLPGILLMASCYLNKYDDGVILFYDSEFGSNDSYFEMFGIDPSRIVHCPVASVESLRNDIAVQFKGIERGQHVFVFVDSVGNLPSDKEVADAESGSDKEDMTRAKKIKSLFRVAFPHLVPKNIPMVVI